MATGSARLIALVALRVVLLGACAGACVAVPIVPTRDDEVVEVLPAVGGNRTEERRLRQQLAQRPTDAAAAVALAKQRLAQAHALGDPRFAGQALAALQAWSDPATMPVDVLMTKADLQQYLHEFDASVESLQTLLARPGEGGRAQAWLTLATVRRVQARYADSDAACRNVARSGAELHGAACLAENAALRGQFDAARATLTRLIAASSRDPASQAWLTTTLAELEQRAGRAAEAEAAYRATLRLQPDDYATLAYADFLIDQQRGAEALALLRPQTRSDAVLLRLAIAGVQSNAPSAAADVAEMRERIAAANERPEAKLFHGREQAMFALAVERRPEQALELARGNVVHQREPLDLLVLAQAAHAAGRPQALQDVKRLLAETGLRDRRTEALL